MVCMCSQKNGMHHYVALLLFCVGSAPGSRIGTDAASWQKERQQRIGMLCWLIEKEFWGWIVIIKDKVLKQKAGINGNSAGWMHRGGLGSWKPLELWKEMEQKWELLHFQVFVKVFEDKLLAKLQSVIYVMINCRGSARQRGEWLTCSSRSLSCQWRFRSILTNIFLLWSKA